MAGCSGDSAGLLIGAMNFWLKYFHIIAMAVWFTGLFLLPRLYLASRREDADHAQTNAIGGALFLVW